MASGFLPGTSDPAFAQFYCGPGDTICIGSWCEPVTTPAARAICPLGHGGRGGTRGAGTHPQTGGRTAGNVNKFPSTTSHQIKPLRCPRAAPYPMAETAYGGLKCGTAEQVKTLQQVLQNPPSAGQGAAQGAQPNQTQPPQAQSQQLKNIENALKQLREDLRADPKDSDPNKITEDLKRLKELGSPVQKPGSRSTSP